MSDDMIDLISISEAARIRNVSHTAIQDLIKRERLSAVMIGGRRLLRRSEVESFQPEAVGRPRKTQAVKASKPLRKTAKKNSGQKERVNG